MTRESRQIFADGDALAHAAGLELLRLAKDSVLARDVFTLALSGGSTPKKLYEALAGNEAFVDFPWSQTHFFFGDERHVPPTDKDSNYRMASEALFSSGKIPSENIRRILAELPDASAAAADYETELRKFFVGPLLEDGLPRFDAVLLGMGPDGHTASLFPGSKGLEETSKWVISNWVKKFKTDRITFTFPVLNASRNVLLLIAGADKADVLQEILVGKKEKYPVEKVRPMNGTQVWMLDKAVAAKLPQQS